MLLPRVLTALAGIPLVAWLVHLGSLPFAAFVLAVSVLCLHEYGLVLRLGGRGVQRVVLVAGGGLLAAAVALGRGGPFGLASGGDAAAVALSLLAAAVMVREVLPGEHSLDRAAFTLLGAVLIGWSLPHLALIRQLRPHGEALTFLLLLTVWSSDMAAYAVGKSVGSRPMAPAVSPRKTWEGAAAGLAAAVAAALALRSGFMPEALGWKGALGVGLLVGTAGQASDLAESVVKRACGAKDSGSLLPGHGGVLDRFDSYLLTAPILYYALALRKL